MSQREITRKTFLMQCSAGFTALLVGCPGDDSTGDTANTAGTTMNDPTASPTTDPDTSDTNPSGPTTGSGPSGSTSSPTSSTTNDPDSSTGPGEESGSSTGNANACMEAVIVAEISMNHGHSLEIPMADVEAGVEQTYDASGDSGHCHEVTLTAEDFATLRAGGAVTKYSCNGGDHEYVLSCAPDPPMPGNPEAECAADPMFGACN